MKKLFSKRSGFTLVEIIVAFAIFAIMSGMILSMIRITVLERKSNMEFAKDTEVETQYLAKHYVGDSDKYDKDTEVDTAKGAFALSFVDNESGDVVCDVSMDYGVRTYDINYDEEGNVVSAAVGKNLDGVNYFVGDTEYKGTEEGSGNEPTVDDIAGAFGNSQTARYDTRISGSKGLDYIEISKVVKDTTYNVPGKSRYFIECCCRNPEPALGTAIQPNETTFLQYKLRFCSTVDYDEKEVISGDKTYIYKIYKEAKILDYGYVNSKTLAWSDSDCVGYTSHSPTSDDVHNKYTVERISDSTMRIGIPFKSGYDKGFDVLSATRFYVVFEGDPKISTTSFGQDPTISNGAAIYKNFPIYDENGQKTNKLNPNIYGAYIYTKEEK